MSSINLKADPAALSQASGKMDDAAQGFQTAYQTVLKAADTAYGSWKGGDAEMFHQRVQALETDFRQIHQLLQGAAQDLRESADRYSDTQNQARSSASSLATSI